MMLGFLQREGDDAAVAKMIKKPFRRRPISSPSITAKVPAAAVCSAV